MKIDQQEALTAMVRAGAVIRFKLGDDVFVQTLGMAQIVGKGLFWSTPYPEDQHHYHLTRFKGPPRIHVTKGKITLPDNAGEIVPAASLTEIPAASHRAFMEGWNRFLAANRKRLIIAFCREMLTRC